MFDKTSAWHYSDVIMSVVASQINCISIVYSTICSGINQRKHQSSASLAFVRGIHRCLVNSLHKGPVMWEMFPFDDVIMWSQKSFITNKTFQKTCLYMVIAVPANGLAPLGAMPSTGTAMTMFRSHIFGSGHKLQLSCYLVLLSIDSKTR